MHPTELSDDALLASLRAICVEGNRLLARMVVHLVEVEERRLHLKAACSSMFDYCVRRLGMSEGAAFRRIAAARLTRKFPCLLPRIEGGDIHLSALVLIRDLVTASNVDELVSEVAGKSKREVQEIVARRAPRPDVPATLRKLPERSAAPATSAVTAAASSTSVPVRQPTRIPTPMATPAPVASGAAPKPALVAPLSDARYRLQLTVSADLRDKLERATDLMRHRNPTGDLAAVLERALDTLLATLEKERLGAAARPSKNVRPSRAGHIARSVRREVFARDGERCTFVDSDRNRCPARALLEVDHVKPKARGGAGDASNLRVRCRAHNRLHAEQVFGKDQIAERVHVRQRVSKRGIEAPLGDDLHERREASPPHPLAPAQARSRPGDSAEVR